MQDPLSPKTARDLLTQARAVRGHDDRAALELFREAFSIAGGAGDQSLAADALNGMANLEHALGESRAAVEHLQTALELRRNTGDPAGEMACHVNLGSVLTDLGDYSGALAHLETALDIGERLGGETRFMTAALTNLGRLAEFVNRFDDALAYYERALKHARHQGNVQHEAILIGNLGEVRRKSGDLEAARQLFEEALERAGDSSPLRWTNLISLGQLWLQQGETERAARSFQESLQLAEALGDVDGMLEARLGLGRTLSDHRRAITVIEQARQLALEAERRTSLPGLLEELARRYQALGEFEQALEILRSAHALERELLSVETARQTRNLLVQFDLERARAEANYHRGRHEAERLAKEAAEAAVAERTRELERLAWHDPLTGLPNRALFRRRLVEALQGEEPLVVGLIDLDRFKYINDTFGHGFGDELLVRVAERLEGMLRGRALLARMGGDEFLMLVRGTVELGRIEQLALEITSSLQRPTKVYGQEIYVAPSIGFALSPEHGRVADVLVGKADQAMYMAKRQGLGWRIFDDAGGQRIPVVTMESALRRALQRGNRDELYLEYQGIHQPDGRVRVGEALLRWSNRQLGRVGPGEFIPVAEDSGLIVPLGSWALRQACLDALSWGDVGVSVNISARQMQERHFLTDVRAALEESGIAPERLQLEITESLMMMHPELARRDLSALKDLGVRVVVDDFGTGYSSLAQLKNYPIDGLKIDRSFVMGIGRDDRDLRIVEATVRMGQALRLDVVAEGVETVEQAEVLRSLGVTALQGFLFSRPAQAHTFLDLLATSAG
ncbi:diguanylate cyclase (GGDEF)-like protein [Deinobacterium chartae]|uniref:Diguanylate cyclase (GGDEF)-like protein n=1 Tax=Deinobacterium chartae TaxID=521158 RepID=A0A841I203_9DEIO|nr:diguanylate cyclase (GGDEF)-like protein [Deinobacterium chartae]